jgi:hypothetical protein
MKHTLSELVGNPQLAKAEKAIVESQAWGDTLSMERTALQAHVSAMRNTARVAISDVLETPPAQQTLLDVEECLADFADCCNHGEASTGVADEREAAAAAEVAEMWVRLRERRDELLSELREKMVALLTVNSTDITAMSTLLQEGECSAPVVYDHNPQLWHSTALLRICRLV